MVFEFDVLFCPDCARDTFAETPPCADGHGADCPDRVCVECGCALIADVLLVEPSRPAAHRPVHDVA